MAGIVAYGAYVPVHRLERRRFGGGAGERAVAGADEDSLTLAVAAAADCLAGLGPSPQPDLVYFASTTAPYREKQAAATLIGALDLGETIRSADFADSLRAGAAAMLAGLDAVRGQSAACALVSIGDCRPGAPGSSTEATGGDGAAAFVFGNEGVLAEVVATCSVSADFVGGWRAPDAPFVSSWEERFSIGEGYLPLVSAAARGVLAKAGLAAADIAKVVLYAPHPRHHAALAGRLGFAESQVQDPLLATVGSAGAAHAPMQLVAALEQAEPGQLILMLSFGEGADAILWRTTAAIRSFASARGVAGHLARRRPIDYQTYLRWRELVPVEPPRRAPPVRPSQPAAWRNRRAKLGLVGVRCTACGTPQFPPQRVCVHCQARDQFEPYRFAGRRARITTFTADYLAGAPGAPNLVAVADFDGGGRMIIDVTDCDAGDLQIGMELETTFRYLFAVGGLRVYFWKSRPAAQGEVR